jgi:hypothetical protein
MTHVSIMGRAQRWSHLVVALAALAPVGAFAQFAAVSQTGSTSASAFTSLTCPGCTSGVWKSDANDKASTPGDLANLSLNSDVSVIGDFKANGGGTVYTTLGSTEIGVYAYTRASTGSAGSTAYYGNVNADAGGGGSAKVTVTFDVLKATDVQVTGTDYYRNPPSTGSFAYTSTLSLSRVVSEGNLLAVTDRANLFGITHLDVGRYVLTDESSFTSPLKSNVVGAGGGAKLSITAVPEPGTFGLMGLGLAAVVAMRRRRQMAGQ